MLDISKNAYHAREYYLREKQYYINRLKHHAKSDESIMEIISKNDFDLNEESVYNEDTLKKLEKNSLLPRGKFNGNKTQASKLGHIQASKLDHINMLTHKILMMHYLANSMEQIDNLHKLQGGTNIYDNYAKTNNSDSSIVEQIEEITNKTFKKISAYPRYKEAKPHKSIFSFSLFRNSRTILCRAILSSENIPLIIHPLSKACSILKSWKNLVDGWCSPSHVAKRDKISEEYCRRMASHPSHVAKRNKIDDETHQSLPCSMSS